MRDVLGDRAERRKLVRAPIFLPYDKDEAEINIFDLNKQNVRRVLVPDKSPAVDWMGGLPMSGVDISVSKPCQENLRRASRWYGRLPGCNSFLR